MGLATTGTGHGPTLRHRCITQVASFPHSRRLTMTWTTPTATDFRFGFEITMYVAAR
jgi:coenzyme PQQ precursor peptide PqqA